VQTFGSAFVFTILLISYNFGTYYMAIRTTTLGRSQKIKYQQNSNIPKYFIPQNYNAPYFVSNHTLHNDLHIKTMKLNLSTIDFTSNSQITTIYLKKVSPSQPFLGIHNVDKKEHKT